MSWLEKMAWKQLRRLIEKEGVGKIVDRHWPAIVQRLEKSAFLETDGTYHSSDVMTAARIACERLLEHLI